MNRHWCGLLAGAPYLALAGPLAAVALAAPIPPQPPAGGPFDPNKLFNRVDANQDGEISASELQQAPPMLLHVLRDADKDGSGTVNRTEFMNSFPPPPPPGMGGRTPGQGGVGAGIGAGVPAFVPGGPPGPGGPGMGPGGPGFGGGIPGGPGAPPQAQPLSAREIDKLFNKLDANHDKKITSDEVPADQQGAVDKLLAAADKNHDSALNKAEFRAGLKMLPSAFEPAAAAGKGPGGPPNGGPPNAGPPAGGPPGADPAKRGPATGKRRAPGAGNPAAE